MKYLLTESMVNTVALYVILQKLMTQFEDWEAYKLGIIDSDGNKLKEPKTSKEIEAWDLLTKFCWNFKKILNKFIGKSRLATFLTASYLLKDSLSLFYIEHNKEKLNELKTFSFNKQTLIYEMIKSLPKIEEKVTEDNFEYLMFLYMEKIDQIILDVDFEKKIC